MAPSGPDFDDWVDARGPALLRLAYTEPASRRPVLDSATAFESRDPNGCPPRVEDDIAMSYDGHMTVCRYDASGLLDESELLDDDQTIEAGEGPWTRPGKANSTVIRRRVRSGR